ncbi:MAG: hypothetical protein ACJA0G_001452, partial [Kangiellaceae bacterium]
YPIIVYASLFHNAHLAYLRHCRAQEKNSHVEYHANNNKHKIYCLPRIVVVVKVWDRMI